MLRDWSKEIIMNRIAGCFDEPEPFAGYQYDIDTSTYYMAARNYGPTVGRWLVEEPVDVDEEAAGEKEA